MANSSRTSGMGHISPADFQAMMAGTKTLPLSSSSSSTATSLGTPKLSIVTQHKRSSTDPTAVLSAADKAAIHRAIEDLKQLQESTNSWFRKLDSLKQIYTLPAHNGTLADSTALCDQLSGFAEETAWIEREVARVETENYELDQQIKSLQSAIDESRALLNSAFEISTSKQSSFSPCVVTAAFIFALIVIVFLILVSFVQRRPSMMHNPWT